MEIEAIRDFTLCNIQEIARQILGHENIEINEVPIPYPKVTIEVYEKGSGDNMKERCCESISRICSFVFNIYDYICWNNSCRYKGI